MVGSSTASRRRLWGIAVDIYTRPYPGRGGRQSREKALDTVRHRKTAPAYTPPDPEHPATEARVTEGSSQNPAVAVLLLAPFQIVGAMLGVARLFRPQVRQHQHHVPSGSGSHPLPHLRLLH